MIHTTKVCVCVCVRVPSILHVRFVDAPAGVTQEEGHTGFLHLPYILHTWYYSLVGSTLTLHTYIHIRVEAAQKNWFMVTPGKEAPVSRTNTLSTTGPVSRWSLGSERHRYPKLRDPMSSGLSRCRLTVEVDAIAESGRNESRE